ncbi:MAG: AraC family transcriptional regulator [Thermoflavifilum sp.]|nr:AraC family transcriptional regulator [Thermoflavifilum sp.]
MRNSIYDHIMREITPLTQTDCFTMAIRVKSHFNFPLHYHEEYELNFIMNAKGAQRVVGDHIEEIDDLELVLVGPNLPHAWFTHHCTSREIREITIQFHKDLFDEKFLRRNQLSLIRRMFEKSLRGILFSRETIEHIMPRIIHLNRKQGFDSVLELMSILHDLSISRNMRILSDNIFQQVDPWEHRSPRIERTLAYIDKHFHRPISLAEVSKLNNMTESAFSRYFRNQTGITFMSSLTEKRLAHASRMLMETQLTIAEIAYKCGFNNISNFNRIFKRRKGCTPREYRERYSEVSRIFI